MKINFEGGDLYSDAELCFGLTIQSPENLLQMIYQIIAAYFEDHCADELTVNPVFTAILEKEAFASQLSTLEQFGMFEGRCGISYMLLCHRNTWFLTSIQPCSILTADRRVKP